LIFYQQAADIFEKGGGKKKHGGVKRGEIKKGRTIVICGYRWNNIDQGVVR
jgi:hypothetical protein